MFLRSILQGVAFFLFWVLVIGGGTILQELAFYLHGKRKRGRR